MRTFFPRSVAGIQEIIRMAGETGARVRASGIRHTTTPWLWGVDSNHQTQYGDTLEYVIAMVPQEGRSYHFSRRLLKLLAAHNLIELRLTCRLPQ